MSTNPHDRDESGAATEPTPRVSSPSWLSAKRLAPLGLLVAGIVAVFAFDLDRFVTFEALRDNRETLSAFVDRNGVFAILAFVGLYAVATALSVPGGAVLSVAAGFLFGTLTGTAAVVVGATIGAVGVFTIARTSLGEPLRAKAGPTLRKMEDGFRENAFSYLLVLRLIPLFPFFLVNIVPAFLGVGYRTYALATVIGIIPGAFVFVSVGAGLDSVFDAGETFNPSSVLTPEVITALVGLALLSLLPVIYKRVTRKRARAAAAS